MVPGHEVFGVRSLAQVVAVLRDERGPRRATGGAAGERAAARRGAGPSGSATSTSPTCTGMADARYRARGGRRRRAPPDAQRAQGRRQDHAGRADPRDPARPQPGGVARAHRDPLAGRHARPRPAADHAPAVLRAAPLRVADQPPRRRHRTGPAGRAEPGAHGVPVPRRVPAVPGRHHRGAAPAAGERRDHHRPRRGDRDLPGPHHVRDRLQPVPVRRVPPRPSATTGAPAPRSGGATTARRSAARSPTGSTSPGTSSRCRPTRCTTRSPARSRPPPCWRGSSPPASARRERYAGTPWRLNADVPGPALRERLPAHRARLSGCSTPSSTPAR